MSSHLRAFTFIFALAATAAFAQGESVRLSELPDDGSLLKLLLSQSPELVNARARVLAARAETDRAHRLPNPGLDLSMNTIPVGPTNPPELANPLANVPNYNVGVSELIELGKRGPRQAAAEHAADAALNDAVAVGRDQLYDFLEAAGQVAAQEEKVTALEELVADAQALTELAQKRVDKGDAAALDFDRAQLDEQKLRSTLSSEREELAAALVNCSRVLGATCEPFGSADKAESFLHSRAELASADLSKLRAGIEDRPDLKSLEAQRKSNEAQAELARAHAIPDPTVRLGYTYDRFLASGNQGNSVNVLLSFPIPLFERGQSDAAQANALANAAERTRTLQLERSRADLQRLVEQGTLANERRAQMHQKTLPLARGVVDRLAQAVKVGGAPVTELLVARRLYGDIVSDAADLDLAALRFTLEIARTSGQGPNVSL